MNHKPEFLDETGARGHALLGLGCTTAVWVGILALAWVVPWMWEQQWWVRLWAVAGAATLAVMTAVSAPMLIKGGTYRVRVQGGRLDVASPHRDFGPSFGVALDEITRLVHRHNPEGPDIYEVHTRAERAYRVSCCGEKLFAALRRLRPEVPLEQRPLS